MASCIHADTARHSARPRYHNIQAIEILSEMHSCFSRLLFCLQRLFCGNSRRACASPYPPAHILPGCTAYKYVLRPMLRRQWDLCAAIATASFIHVGPWSECHRRHITSLGTPCADPSSYKSLPFTGRVDMFTGILRQHEGTLGAFSISCSILLPLGVLCVLLPLFLEFVL